MKNKCPWKDFAGNDLYEGDFIIHPNGEKGKILHFPARWNIHSQWMVDYQDGSPLSRLSMQIGDKGMAVLFKSSF